MNFPQFLTQDHQNRNLYTIMVLNLEDWYFRAIFGYSHEDVAWQAALQRIYYGMPIMTGTFYSVEGPCAAPGCKCTGVHIFLQASDTEIVEHLVNIR